MLENLHFLFFLGNMALWAISGLILSYAIIQNKKIRIASKKIIVVGVMGALFGGSFGFLANGIPDLSSSVQNITAAVVFSALGTYAIIPRGKKIKNK